MARYNVGRTMTDEQFIERASHILHNMALERKGFWQKLWRRWHINDEPLRNDASRLLIESGKDRSPPEGTGYVIEDDNPFRMGYF